MQKLQKQQQIKPNIETRETEDLDGFIPEFFGQDPKPPFSCKLDLTNDRKEMPTTDSEANYFLFQLLGDILKGGIQFLYKPDDSSKLTEEQWYMLNKYMNSLGFFILLNPSKEQLDLYKSCLLPYKLYLISQRNIMLFSTSPIVVFGELQS